MTTPVGRNGDVSFWYADMGGLPAYRAALDEDRSTDVCIVGGGYTGLWTAYALLKADPGLRVVVLEQAFAGFGASGRNGGWLSGEFAGAREGYAKRGGRDGVIALQRAMIGAVDEVIGTAQAEGIDADIRRTDILTAACTPAQMARLRARHAEDEAWDLPAGRQSLVDAAALAIAHRDPRRRGRAGHPRRGPGAAGQAGARPGCGGGAAGRRDL